MPHAVGPLGYASQTTGHPAAGLQPATRGLKEGLLSRLGFSTRVCVPSDHRAGVRRSAFTTSRVAESDQSLGEPVAFGDADTRRWHAVSRGRPRHRDPPIPGRPPSARIPHPHRQEASAWSPSTASRPSRPRPSRRRGGACPTERRSLTHKFCVDGHEGYLTAGLYDDGTVGELFITDVGKEGSTLRGVFSAWATTLSIALQHGVPLESLVRKFAYMRFEPRGATDNPEIPQAHSIPDYVARWLASRFLDVDTQDELGVLTAEVKRRRAAALDGHGTAPLRALPDPGPPCPQCGAGFMVRTGTCLTCSTCGHNTGCG